MNSKLKFLDGHGEILLTIGSFYYESMMGGCDPVKRISPTVELPTLIVMIYYEVQDLGQDEDEDKFEEDDQDLVPVFPVLARLKVLRVCCVGKCFARGIKVLMYDGTHQNVEELNYDVSEICNLANISGFFILQKHEERSNNITSDMEDAAYLLADLTRNHNSTNLSKTCTKWIKGRFDTFRSGAVEQLRVHVALGQNSNVQLYETYLVYGKDAAIKLTLRLNNPDKIVFVGEALAGVD
uniref:Uncharacterized protein n=1 Tax=Rhizophagus irregularis (strain DAOM 181602 / DAOM 197198 / MUCL 43194) TaxID=747089 RepID=U9UBN7_RHIID